MGQEKTHTHTHTHTDRQTETQAYGLRGRDEMDIGSAGASTRHAGWIEARRSIDATCHS